MKTILIERSYLDASKHSFKAACQTLQLLKEDNHHIEAIIYGARWATLHALADKAECLSKLMQLEGHNIFSTYETKLREDLFECTKMLFSDEQFEEFRMCF